MLDRALRTCPVIKRVLRNFAKFAGKHLWSATLLKKRLWHWCFPVNFAKFLRTPFFTEHSSTFTCLCTGSIKLDIKKYIYVY